MKKNERYIHRVVDGHDIHFDQATSVRMGGVRQKDTTPELAVRKVLTAMGLHYRVRNRDLPGSPDIANRKQKWAVFVHGCYWHRHPGCSKATTPKRNADFWIAKFDANVARDRRATESIADLGYRLVVIWECEAQNTQLVTDKLSAIHVL